MKLAVLGPSRSSAPPSRRVAMLGLPNVGKSSLFTRLVGGGRRTANAIGTSQDACSGCVTCTTGCELGSETPDQFELVDLPGVYDLAHDTPEARVCREAVAHGAAPGAPVERPDALLVVIEALDLTDGLRLLRSVAHTGIPVVVAVNMIDEATRQGVEVSDVVLSERLGCPVIQVSARLSTGVTELRDALSSPEAARPVNVPLNEDEIASIVRSASISGELPRSRVLAAKLSDGFDHLATHPVFGAALFISLMASLLWAVLKISEIPGGWLEEGLAALGGWITGALPEGFLASLVGEGIFGGVGGVVVFVPQIFATFVVLALLEHTGYASRATLAVDRLLRPFGLSGRAFIPMLTSYGCAIPAVIAARSIKCKRERLATILAIPFLGCPARVPVYVLLTAVLFPGSALQAALAMLACYAVSVAAALLTSLLARRTLAKGTTAPFVVELPPYRRPSFRAAFATGASRSLAFLKKAGTLILAASLLMWTLESVHVSSTSDPRTGQGIHTSALDALGQAAQPAFAPLGFDDQITVGVLTSFAARELFVSAMAVQQEIDEDETEPVELRERITSATKADGSPVFTTATSWSLLVFFALSTQCLSTLAITAREARSAWIAAGQFVWAFALAYGLAFAVHAVLA
ncbi:MAG: ferrous iron transporter B [Planctomycetota bacterium]